MRCFLGLPVTGQLRRQLQLFCAVIADDSVQWEAADDWHLTLAFLGQVSEDRLATLLPLLGAVCEQALPVSQPLTGPQPFPAQGSRLLALEGAPSRQLSVLHEATVQACAAAGVALVPHGFRPHVTLAREHEPTPMALAPVSLEANEMVLYLSGERDAAGRRYRRLASWPLGRQA